MKKMSNVQLGEEGRRELPRSAARSKLVLFQAILKQCLFHE